MVRERGIQVGVRSFWFSIERVRIWSVAAICPVRDAAHWITDEYDCPVFATFLPHHRCSISNSDAARIVRVMQALQDGRAAGNVFAGRHGFITPRDLFRWAGRGGHGDELAINGFAVLGERLRNAEERSIVRQAIQTELRIKVRNLERSGATHCFCDCCMACQLHACSLGGLGHFVKEGVAALYRIVPAD